MEFLEDDALSTAPISEEQVGSMVCPFCAHIIGTNWQLLSTLTNELGALLRAPAQRILVESMSSQMKTYLTDLTLRWTKCHNGDCGQIIVQATRTRYHAVGGVKTVVGPPETWIAIPARPLPKPVSNLLPANFARDYREAESILGDSPRMSAVMSRRILADLLETYADQKDYNLADRIDGFIQAPGVPSNLKQNLHYLRKIGNFSAHSLKNSEDVVIDATPEEADWTLKVIRDLFDHFIVAPETDKQLRAGIDKKMEKKDRKKDG